MAGVGAIGVGEQGRDQLPKSHQAPAVAIGERFEDHGIDKREDRRAGPDAEGEG